jgi:glycosyltransferase involved in cell wall biosynthesis
MTPVPNPKISIVIAVLNGSATVKRCLESIESQTYQNREIIICDGGSTDETLEIIAAFSKPEYRLLHGPDSGIYDAWNKALDVVSGDWICFLGCDDAYACESSLATFVDTIRAATPDTEMVTARCALVNTAGTVLKEYGRQWHWLRERRRHAICHPGALHRTSLFARLGRFDTGLRICADYDFNLRAGSHLKTAHTDEVLLLVGDGGVCRRRAYRTIFETWHVQARHPDIGALRAAGSVLPQLLERALFDALGYIGAQQTLRKWLLRSRITAR